MNGRDSIFGLRVVVVVGFLEITAESTAVKFSLQLAKCIAAFENLTTLRPLDGKRSYA